MVDQYIEVKHGRKPAEYPHPVMKEVLEETHGVMVYQEQVMRILNRLGGIELANAGWDVWFYEDIPYALKPGAFDARLAEVPSSIPLAITAQVPIEATWERKLDAIFSYPSQLETVFRSYVGVGTTREEIGTALADYANGVGDGQLAERFWRVSRQSIALGS